MRKDKIFTPCEHEGEPLRNPIILLSDLLFTSVNIRLVSLVIWIVVAFFAGVHLEHTVFGPQSKYIECQALTQQEYQQMIDEAAARGYAEGQQSYTYKEAGARLHKWIVGLAFVVFFETVLILGLIYSFYARIHADRIRAGDIQGGQ